MKRNVGPDLREEKSLTPITSSDDIRRKRRQPGLKTRLLINVWTRLQRMFGIELRSLALTRIFLSLTVIGDLLNRSRWLYAHYGQWGILPASVAYTEYMTDRNLGFYFINCSEFGLMILVSIHIFFAILMGIGYLYPYSNLIVWVLVLGIQARNPLVGHGGDGYMRFILLFSLLLPTNSKYSMDDFIKKYKKSLFRSVNETYSFNFLSFDSPHSNTSNSSLSSSFFEKTKKTIYYYYYCFLESFFQPSSVYGFSSLLLSPSPPESQVDHNNQRPQIKMSEERERQKHLYFSITSFLIFFQMTLMYVISTYHKTGQPWINGTATYYALNLDYFRLPLGDFLLPHYDLLIILTHFTFYIERYFVLFAFSPILTSFSRMFCFVNLFFMHLGFGLCLAIGMFFWICITPLFCLWPYEMWSFLSKVYSKWRFSSFSQHHVHNSSLHDDSSSPSLSLLTKSPLSSNSVLLSSTSSNSSLIYNSTTEPKTNVSYEYMKERENWVVMCDAINYCNLSYFISLICYFGLFSQINVVFNHQMNSLPSLSSFDNLYGHSNNLKILHKVVLSENGSPEKESQQLWKITNKTDFDGFLWLCSQSPFLYFIYFFSRSCSCYSLFHSLWFYFLESNYVIPYIFSFFVPKFVSTFSSIASSNNSYLQTNTNITGIIQNSEKRLSKSPDIRSEEEKEIERESFHQIREERREILRGLERKRKGRLRMKFEGLHLSFVFLQVISVFFISYILFHNLSNLEVTKMPSLVWKIGRPFKLEQSWKMFSPQPPSISGFHWINATDVDGNTFELLQNYGILTWERKPFFTNTPDPKKIYISHRWYKIWEQFNKQEKKKEFIRLEVGRYICREFNRRNKGKDQLKKFTINWTSHRQLENYKREKSKTIAQWNHICF